MTDRFPPLAPQEPRKSRIPALLEALPLSEAGILAAICALLLLA